VTLEDTQYLQSKFRGQSWLEVGETVLKADHQYNPRQGMQVDSQQHGPEVTRFDASQCVES